jgi:hypothetical protein
VRATRVLKLYLVIHLPIVSKCPPHHGIWERGTSLSNQTIIYLPSSSRKTLSVSLTILSPPLPSFQMLVRTSSITGTCTSHPITPMQPHRSLYPCDLALRTGRRQGSMYENRKLPCVNQEARNHAKMWNGGGYGR